MIRVYLSGVPPMGRQCPSDGAIWGSAVQKAIVMEHG